jgi:hypothetical protein
MIQESRLGLPKPTAGAMKLCNFHPTLPSVLFPSVGLIPLSVTPHVCCCTLFIVIGEIEIKVNSIPDRLPHLCPAGFVGLMLASVSSLLTARSSVGRTVAGTTVCLGLKGAWIRFSLGAAMVAEPMSVRDLLQAYAIGMPQLLTTITIHKHVFVVVFFADLACLSFKVFVW